MAKQVQTKNKKNEWQRTEKLRSKSQTHLKQSKHPPPKISIRFGTKFRIEVVTFQNTTPRPRRWYTLPKTNMDTQNDGLEKVTPLKNGNCWYLC